MSVQETTNRLSNNKIGHQDIPADSFCHEFGFHMNTCKYNDTCEIIRAPLLLFCLIIDEKKHTYYPIEYANELTLIPEEVRTETTIVEQCSCGDDGLNERCQNPIFYSRIFRDTYIRYAEEQGKIFKMYCSSKCKAIEEQKLIDAGYKCTKAKPIKRG